MIFSDGPDGEKNSPDDFGYSWTESRLTVRPPKPERDVSEEEAEYSTLQKNE